MTTDSDNNIDGFIEKVKCQILVWFTDQFRNHGKSRISLSECKDAFMKIHPEVLKNIFDQLVVSGDVDLDVNSGRSLVYVLNVSKAKISSPIKKVDNSLKSSIKKRKLNVDDENRKNITIVETNPQKASAKENYESHVHESVPLIWRLASPEKKINSVSIALIDQLMTILNSAFRDTNSDSISMSQLMTLIEKSTMVITEQELELSLSQLNDENKIMSFDGEVYRV